MRRALAALAVLLGACGGGGPGPEPTASPPAATTTVPATTPAPADDEGAVRAEALRVAGEQRPGEEATVVAVTFFDDPAGCPSGEAALATLEFEGQPRRGDVVLCRTAAGWEVTQGILYGE